MGYPATPLAYCTGTWPTGPFAAPPGTPASDGDLVAVRAVASLAAAMTQARQERRWSRATLSRAAELAPHTVGRIEAGQAWPDLATIARLAHALDLEIALVPARPAPQERVGGEIPSDRPLGLDIASVDEPTAAHVIEAILHTSPRIAANVESLRRRRRDTR